LKLPLGYEKTEFSVGINRRKPMHKRWPFASLVGFLALLPLPVLAHTGMGATNGVGAGFAHPLGGLDHLLAMVAVGLWAAQMGGRALWLVPGGFVAMMLAGGMLGLTGVALPYVELGIAASLLVIGALTAAAFKLPPLIGALLVGTFALFHGHAHGAEMPVATTAASYAIGFATMTALLHLAGAAGSITLRRLSAEGAIRLTGGAIALSGVWFALA
jgi:urease accessory protein